MKIGKKLMEHFLRCHFWVWRIFIATILTRFDRVFFLTNIFDQCWKVLHEESVDLYQPSWEGELDSWCGVDALCTSKSLSLYPNLPPKKLARACCVIGNGWPFRSLLSFKFIYTVHSDIVFLCPQACEVPKANLSALLGMCDWMLVSASFFLLLLVFLFFNAARLAGAWKLITEVA